MPGRSYAGADDESRKAARRARLMQAAFELFGAPDSDGTPSVEKICSRASVATRSVYEEFGGRDQLLAAVHQHVLHEADQQVLLVAGRCQAGPSERARTLVTAYVLFLTANPRRARIAYYAVAPAHQMGGAHPSPAKKLVRAVLDANTSTQDPTGLTEVALNGAVNALVANWVNASPRPSVTDLIEEAVKVFTCVLAIDEQVEQAS